VTNSTSTIRSVRIYPDRNSRIFLRFQRQIVGIRRSVEAEPFAAPFTGRFFAIQLTLGIAGCSTNPITGRSQIMLVSDNDAARVSAQAYDQLLLNTEKQQVLDEDPAMVNRVRSISKPLIAQATTLRPETRDCSWEVHVLQSDEVNAW
jgi:predicted Zn-dependent protease